MFTTVPSEQVVVPLRYVIISEKVLSSFMVRKVNLLMNFKSFLLVSITFE